MHALARLPVVALFALLIGSAFVVAALLSWLSARAVESDVRSRTSGSVTTVVGVVAGLYAVLVAFVIVNEWQTLNDANSYVDSEAGSLAAVYGAADTFPAADREAVQQSLLTYVNRVVCDELPYLEDHDQPSPRAVAALRHVYSTLASVSPEARRTRFYESAVAELSDLTSARRERVSSSSGGVPDELLVVVIATSIVLIAVTSVLDTQHRRWHAVLMGAVALLVALNLALILSLSRPYDGAASVSTAPLTDGVPARSLVCSR
jgi:hypothetical protein